MQERDGKKGEECWKETKERKEKVSRVDKREYFTIMYVGTVCSISKPLNKDRERWAGGEG